jgi:hypothetical protein
MWPGKYRKDTDFSPQGRKGRQENTNTGNDAFIFKDQVL